MTVSLARLVRSDAGLPHDAGSIAIHGLTADSRQVKPGFVFAALPGTAADGAKFIPQAIAAGAVAIVAGAGVETRGVPVIASSNPRRLFALMAARFSGRQPDLVVAVTGTNGKTSVAAFVREIWTSMGFRAASLGTIGVVSPAGTVELQHTTPDPVKLQEIAAGLAEDHVEHLVLEASSHGLAQYRLDGLRMAAGAFTNITRDHLDYHPTFEDYFNAKMRLFEELLQPGSPAVINMDTPHGGGVLARAHGHGLKDFTVGREGTALRLLSAERDGFGQRLDVQGPMRRHSVLLPLVGDFQASNALVAAGLVIATGGEEALAMHALENAIVALRPYVKAKLAVVFGCGGDRDKGKRPQMGAIAARLADIAYVTDDNPRNEDASDIRSQVLAGAPGAIEIGNRGQAIRAAVDALAPGDVLLVAGKGHEEGQKIGKTVIPFSDHEAVKAAIRGVDYHG